MANYTNDGRCVSSIYLTICLDWKSVQSTALKTHVSVFIKLPNLESYYDPESYEWLFVLTKYKNYTMTN